MNIEEFKIELENVRVWYDNLTDLDIYKPWLLYKKDELFIALAYLVSNNTRDAIDMNSQTLKSTLDKHNKIEQTLYSQFSKSKSARSKLGYALNPEEWVNLILYKHNILKLNDSLAFKSLTNGIEENIHKYRLLSKEHGYLYGITGKHIYVEHNYKSISITEDLNVIPINDSFLILNTDIGYSEYWLKLIAPLSAYISQFKLYQKDALRSYIGKLPLDKYHLLLKTLNNDSTQMIKTICMLHESPLLEALSNEEIIPILYKTLACYTDKETLDNAFKQYQLTKSIKHIELILTGDIADISPVDYEPTSFDLI